MTAEQCCFCTDGNPDTTDPCMECGLLVCGRCSRGDAEWLCPECYEPEDDFDDDDDDNFGDCVDDCVDDYMEDDYPEHGEWCPPDCDCFGDEEDE